MSILGQRKRATDPEGVTHAWERWRSAPDDHDDITDCEQWIPDFPEEKGWKMDVEAPIDCVGCLGSEKANRRFGDYTDYH